ncbi:D-alanyl-D-alanine carboxypeptidase family protein [Bacillaceae bacterium S4-13-58]
MKKLSILLVVLMFFSMTPQTIFGEESKDSGVGLAKKARSAILIERDTGEVLFKKNADEELPPASMTKIMTLLLIMEALDNGALSLDEKVRASEYAASMGGSQIFLEAGEEMTVEDLLKGIAVASGNDASVALAEKIAGSEEMFVKKMNEKAKELGLKNTKFQNTTGLPESDHYSTANDMAVMARELLKYENITKYTGIYEDYLRKDSDDPFWLVNTNKLVRFYDGVDGLKTGYTSEAKYCLTATAEKNGMRVIAVVMGEETPKTRNAEVSQMLDYAFSQYETKKLFERNEVVDQLRLTKGEPEQVDIYTSEPISILIKKGQEMDGFSTETKIDNNVKAPLKRGDKIGMLLVKDGEETIYKSPLVVGVSVDKASLWSLWKRNLMDQVLKIKQ